MFNPSQGQGRGGVGEGVVGQTDEGARGLHVGALSRSQLKLW